MSVCQWSPAQSSSETIKPASAVTPDGRALSIILEGASVALSGGSPGEAVHSTVEIRCPLELLDEESHGLRVDVRGFVSRSSGVSALVALQAFGAIQTITFDGTDGEVAGWAFSRTLAAPLPAQNQCRQISIPVLLQITLVRGHGQVVSEDPPQDARIDVDSIDLVVQ